MRLLCSLLTLAACLGPSVLQAQTCAERFDVERALIVAIPTQANNLATATANLLAAHDAMKAANCILGAPPIELHAAPLALFPTQQVTATWANVNTPTARDWIGLYLAAQGDQQFITWVYTSSCTQTPGTARPSGQCLFNIPSNAQAGNFNLRLYRNDGYGKIATSETIVVSIPPGGQGIPSPNGTRVPPAPSLVDAEGGTWSLRPKQAGETYSVVLRNGVSVTLAAAGWDTRGETLKFVDGQVYADGDGTGPDWYRWIGAPNYWQYIGSTEPGPVPPGGGARVIADHPGTLAQLNDTTGQPIPGKFHDLVFDLYVDEVKVLRQTKAQAWAIPGTVTIQLPSTITSGPHAIRIGAVYVCPQNEWCAGSETPAGYGGPTPWPGMSATIAYEKP